MKRLPAEWEKQDSILMVFPHKNTDWANDMQSAQSIFLRMASSISATQKLILVCDDVKKQRIYFVIPQGQARALMIGYLLSNLTPTIPGYGTLAPSASIMIMYEN